MWGTANSYLDVVIQTTTPPSPTTTWSKESINSNHVQKVQFACPRHPMLEK
jgi:hypothetical protein